MWNFRHTSSVYFKRTFVGWLMELCLVEQIFVQARLRTRLKLQHFQRVVNFWCVSDKFLSVCQFVCRFWPLKYNQFNACQRNACSQSIQHEGNWCSLVKHMMFHNHAGSMQSRDVTRDCIHSNHRLIKFLWNFIHSIRDVVRSNQSNKQDQSFG